MFTVVELPANECHISKYRESRNITLYLQSQLLLLKLDVGEYFFLLFSEKKIRAKYENGGIEV